MTKQEEIKEGLIKDVLPCRWADIIKVHNPHGYELYPDMIEDLADDILKYLDSQGCVLKVEGELPLTSKGWRRIQQDLIGCGYCLTEPLIGDE